MMATDYNEQYEGSCHSFMKHDHTHRMDISLCRAALTVLDFFAIYTGGQILGLMRVYMFWVCYFELKTNLFS